jgi:phosphoribosylanthranilate isomerase
VILQAAGIRDVAEARMLADAGFTHLGFPLRLAHHAPDTTDREAAAIVRGLRATHAVEPVLITYLADAVAIADLAAAIGATIVQLHGEVATRELEALRARSPALSVWKSLIVAGDGLPGLQAEVARCAAHVDAFLTDTFDPATGATGATGKPHDWNVSAALVRCAPRPVVLAGGLTPQNVAAAIAQVRPAGVDVHTGIEAADGSKDPIRARSFVAGARAAFGA